jgi:integrase
MLLGEEISEPQLKEPRTDAFGELPGPEPFFGVTLHSYRYAWAERAKCCGYPARFTQEALGHNSKAVHRAYARQAKVIVPSWDEYESRAAANVAIPLRFERCMKQQPMGAESVMGEP